MLRQSVNVNAVYRVVVTLQILPAPTEQFIFDEQGTSIFVFVGKRKSVLAKDAQSVAGDQPGDAEKPQSWTIFKAMRKAGRKDRNAGGKQTPQCRRGHGGSRRTGHHRSSELRSRADLVFTLCGVAPCMKRDRQRFPNNRCFAIRMTCRH